MCICPHEVSTAARTTLDHACWSKVYSARPCGSNDEQVYALQMPSGAFERPSAGSWAAPDGKDAGEAREAEPRHCILLRAGGLMSVLDMEQGAAFLTFKPL